MTVSLTSPVTIRSRRPTSVRVFQLVAFQWYFASAIVSYWIYMAVMWLTSFLPSNLSREKP